MTLLSRIGLGSLERTCESVQVSAEELQKALTILRTDTLLSVKTSTTELQATLKSVREETLKSVTESADQLQETLKSVRKNTLKSATESASQLQLTLQSVGQSAVESASSIKHIEKRIDESFEEVISIAKKANWLFDLFIVAACVVIFGICRYLNSNLEDTHWSSGLMNLFMGISLGTALFVISRMSCALIFRIEIMDPDLKINYFLLVSVAIIISWNIEGSLVYGLIFRMGFAMQSTASFVSWCMEHPYNLIYDLSCALQSTASLVSRNLFENAYDLHYLICHIGSAMRSAASSVLCSTIHFAYFLCCGVAMLGICYLTVLGFESLTNFLLVNLVNKIGKEWYERFLDVSYCLIYLAKFLFFEWLAFVVFLILFIPFCFLQYSLMTLIYYISSYCPGKGGYRRRRQLIRKPCAQSDLEINQGSIQ